MKIVLASLLLAAGTCVCAQPPADAPGRAAALPCADCGVVKSMRPISKELRPAPGDEGEPSGLVATMPLGGGEIRAGSSSRIGRDAPNVVTQWEVVVRLDDGRLRLVTLQSKPEFAEGDRVRVEGARLMRPPQ